MHPFSMLGGDELSVGKNLEIAVPMGFEKIEEFLMDEGFSSQDAKKALPAATACESSDIFFRYLLGRRCHINPTSLAA